MRRFAPVPKATQGHHEHPRAESITQRASSRGSEGRIPTPAVASSDSAELRCSRTRDQPLPAEPRRPRPDLAGQVVDRPAQTGG